MSSPATFPRRAARGLLVFAVAAAVTILAALATVVIAFLLMLALS
jgi:acyl dehydratase